LAGKIVPPVGLLDELRKRKRFLIFGHVEPDGDCLASQIVLAEFLRRQGKSVELFSSGPFDRPETSAFEALFRSEVLPADLEGDPAAVVMDCSTPDRVGALTARTRKVPLVVIDHHSSGRSFGAIRWVEPTAPATSFLVQLLIEAYPASPGPREAELLLFGLATDTGFFRHLEAGSGETFAAVARLVDAGASPRSVYRRAHGGWELGKVHLLARSLDNARLELNGRIVITTQSLRDRRESGAALTRGSDETYAVLQGLQGVEVVAFLREEASGTCAVGLRSNGQVDVGALAAAQGGGGHPRAAGYSRKGTLPEAEAELLTLLEARLGRG
jgi:phosphoesterase RecJ-like protein